ncbi:Sec-independent protein translocase protein TatB [Colwelliaceae bacterium BS250]
MFDIGFWELTIIAVMGLVVLGPERLPTAIRTIRAWVTNIKQFSNSVQTELKEELRVHELHTNLKKAEQQGLKNLAPELEESVRSLKEAAEEATRPYAKEKQPKSDVTDDK